MDLILNKKNGWCRPFFFMLKLFYNLLLVLTKIFFLDKGRGVKKIKIYKIKKYIKQKNILNKKFYNFINK